MKVINYKLIIISVFFTTFTAQINSNNFNSKNSNNYIANNLYYGNTSLNFINRWAFQSLCDFQFDPYLRPDQIPTNPNGGVTFNPKDVKHGDLVFVRNVPLFFQTMHPRINVPYFIMTHGDCRDQFKDDYIKYINDKKIIRWFGIHLETDHHPKFVMLPIGIIQRRHLSKNCDETYNLFKELREQTVKSKLLLINFKGKTYRPYKMPTRAITSERNRIKYLFDRKSYCTQLEPKPLLEYFKDMAKFKFTLCPRGAGQDTYRAWEALMVGSIPIIKSSALDPLYHNLPVLIIRHWEDVADKKFLERKHKEITSRKYNIEKLFMEHWANLIKRVRSSYKF